MLFHSYCIYMAKHLIFLSEVSASPQTPCSSAFRLKDIHDKILQPEKIFQRDRVSDAVLFGFLSVFGFLYIYCPRLKERTARLKDLSASICQPKSRWTGCLRRGWNFWRIFWGILRERGISLQKMDVHIKKNIRRLWILAARCRNSCSKFLGIL